MIITKTPFRISLFGGGTDYPDWYMKNGGCVLSTTIDKYCYITCRKMPDFFDHRYRIMYAKIENCKEAMDIQHPIVRETLRYLQYKEGLEIHHDADLPARSGVGSSSAFAVGFIKAILTLKNEPIVRPSDLTAVAIYVERNLVGDKVGDQDQAAAAYGGFNKITFENMLTPEVTPVHFEGTKTKDLERHLMLFHTNKYRIASDVANTIQFVSELKVIQALPDVAIEHIAKEEWEDLGMLLHYSWRLKQTMSKSISCSDTEAIYEAALRAGAWGGKVIGAGGGGCMLFMVPPEKQQKVKEALSKLVHVPFKFESKGTEVIFNNE